MEGEITEDICTRSLRWIQQQDKDTEPWLWKFPNCFSAAEKKLPLTPKKVGFDRKRDALKL